MIKANELRIGNIVEWNKSIFNVCKISEDSIENELWRKPLKELHPIPLTEEWLFKFGANKYGLSYEYDRFLLTYKKEYKYWYVRNQGYYYLRKVEFVHEWQNFVFVMNGQELELK